MFEHTFEYKSFHFQTEAEWEYAFRGETMKTESSKVLGCLVIDDPIIKPHYGCINFKILLEKMKQHHFFTELAFIPWNWNRCNNKTVTLFKENPDYFGICVHGCNHTRSEFADTNYTSLTTLTTTAITRMNQFAKKTGLTYDPVFVFPQGKFSSHAMKILKNCGFFAAFNSGIKAIDMKLENIPQEEFVKPVTRMYHDFPLYTRRYPKSRSEFMADIQAGRPIIIVGHHEMFMYGYDEFTELIDWLNSVTSIEWTSLLNIAQQYQGTYRGTLYNSTAIPYQESVTDFKIHTRRYLSEFRDNVIQPNVLLEKCYSYYKKHR